MVLALRQDQRLLQQLVMTPQLQQAIRLLQLSRLEMVAEIREELIQNPILEEKVDSDEPSENLKKELDQLKKQELEREHSSEEKEVKGSTDDIDWNNYLENYNSYSAADPSYSRAGINTDDIPSVESTLTEKETLREHLVWQLRLSELSKIEEGIGELIISFINDDGYLKADEEDEDILDVILQIAKDILPEEITRESIEKALYKIQEFDPPGVGARTIKECLEIQVKIHKIDNKHVINIIENHLDDLKKKNVKAIIRKLKVSSNELEKAVKILARMDIWPGRIFPNEDVEYVTPDVYIFKVGEEYVIMLNEDGMPKLKVNDYYVKLIKDKSGDQKAKEYIKEKLKSAQWLIKSIHQRQSTIYKVTESIVEQQSEYFEKGSDFLKPMVLRDIAERIGMHEATVSRVTSNKYVQTPHGLKNFKYFFNSGVGEVASESVKTWIKKMIELEDSKKPLSDQKIVELLKNQRQVTVARRTVTKYREMLGILKSSSRKQMF